MKIVYANALGANAGWGAEVFLKKALEKQGIEIQNIDYRVRRGHVAKTLLEMNEFDLFFLQRGDYFPLYVLKSLNVPTVFYFSELITRCRDADHLFRSNTFSHYLVRGNACQDLLSKRNRIPDKKVRLFLSAVDPATYHPVATEKSLDVLFVGALTKRRRQIIQAIKESNIQICHVSAYGAEANRFYNQARIVLNLHAEDYTDTETRVFECLGSGAFLISEKLAQENPLLNGKHYVEASGIPELVNCIRFYLEHENERHAIAEAGKTEIARFHTYDSRAVELKHLFEHLVVGRQCPVLNESKMKRASFFEPLEYFYYKKKEGFSRRLQSVFPNHTKLVGPHTAL